MLIHRIQIKNQDLFCEYSILKKNIQNNIENSMYSDKTFQIILRIQHIQIKNQDLYCKNSVL